MSADAGPESGTRSRTRSAILDAAASVLARDQAATMPDIAEAQAEQGPPLEAMRRVVAAMAAVGDRLLFRTPALDDAGPGPAAGVAQAGEAGAVTEWGDHHPFRGWEFRACGVAAEPAGRTTA
jgi:hypothetical protein